MKKLVLLLSLVFLANFSAGYAQEQDPAGENTYFFTCRTYVDGGYLLTATGRFAVATNVGVVEVAIQHPDDYTMPARLRFSLALNAQNTSTQNFNGLPGYVIKDDVEAADTSLKIVFAKKLTENSGEIFLNDDSYEVYCTKELDIY